MGRDWISDVPETNHVLVPILDRVRMQIFEADRAWSIYETVGRFSNDINAQNYGDVFGSIQNACLDQLTLSLTKLFELPNPRYEILSIPVVLRAVMENADTLVILHDIDLVTQLGLPRIKCPTVDSTRSRQAVEQLRSTLPRPEDTDPCVLSRSLMVHKTRRDKSVAHSEAVDPATLPSTTWRDSKRLLDVAKRAVGIIAFAYTGLALIVDRGTYVLTSDAERGGMALRRLFRSAGIMPNGPDKPPDTS